MFIILWNVCCVKKKKNKKKKGFDYIFQPCIELYIKQHTLPKPGMMLAFWLAVWLARLSLVWLLRWTHMVISDLISMLISSHSALKMPRCSTIRRRHGLGACQSKYRGRGLPYSKQTLPSSNWTDASSNLQSIWIIAHNEVDVLESLHVLVFSWLNVLPLINTKSQNTTEH